jgi:hypothetical protein
LNESREFINQSLPSCRPAVECLARSIALRRRHFNENKISPEMRLTPDRFSIKVAASPQLIVASR